MRLLPASTLVATLLIAAPCAAQDWLSGLARRAVETTTERLVNRAVSAVTTPSAPIAPNSNAASSPDAAATAARASRYNSEGDRIFPQGGWGATRFHGQAVWRGAAQCAALQELVGIHIELQKARYAKGGGEFTEDMIETARASAAENAAKQTEFGLLRLRIDRPGADHDALFEAERRDQEAALRQEDWSATDSWRMRDGECTSFYDGQRGLRYDMVNGRGEGSRPAPAL